MTGQAFREFKTPFDNNLSQSKSVTLSIHLPRPRPPTTWRPPFFDWGGYPIGFVVQSGIEPPPPPPAPTGIVRFLRGDQILAEVPVDDTGTATYRPLSQKPGNYQIRAVYVGDQNYQTSASDLLTYAVTKAVTSTRISASKAKVMQGGSVALTATTSTVDDNTSPDGWIILTDGRKRLAKLRLGSKVKIVDWDLSLGTHLITATYSGNKNCLPSTSTVIKLTVKKS